MITVLENLSSEVITYDYTPLVHDLSNVVVSNTTATWDPYNPDVSYNINVLNFPGDVSVKYLLDNKEFNGASAVGTYNVTALLYIGEQGTDSYEVLGSYNAVLKITLPIYNISFCNDDGNVLYVQQVEYGNMPEYGGETPAKEATDKYTYTFDGWASKIIAVDGNATYTATYSQSINKYTFTFFAEDGTTVFSKITADYGSSITMNLTPIKAATAQYTYTFSGWGKEIPTTITEDITFTAAFTSAVNSYSVVFVTEGGSAVANLTVEYGKTITLPAAPTKDGYKFIGWFTDSAHSTEFSATATVSANVTLYAKWESDGTGAIGGIDTEGCSSVVISNGSLMPLLCFGAIVACLFVVVIKKSKKSKKNN